MDEQPDIKAQLAEAQRRSQAFDTYRRKLVRTINAALILLALFALLWVVFAML